jgi:pimeloyl-ACP methyl ester carboxylesterase
MRQESWIETSRGRLFARIWGRRRRDTGGKAPIVLFHDSLGSVELWREFPERLALATERSVIAYDRLGYGKSDPYPGQPGIDFIREEAHVAFPALCDQLEIDRFVGLGHSVGGGMAIAAAAAFPARCQAVVTESAQAFVERRTTEGISDAKRAFGQERQLDRLRKYHGDKAEWVFNAWIETWLSPAFAGWNLDEDLAGVQCPVLAIHGENDEYGSVAHPERIGALARGPATVAILRACGHVPHREKEAAVLDAVREFLAQCGS